MGLAVAMALAGCSGAGDAPPSAPSSRPGVTLAGARTSTPGTTSTPGPTTTTSTQATTTTATVTTTTTPPPTTTTPPAPTTEPPPPPESAYSYTFPAQDDSCDYPSSHHDYPAADIFCPIGTPFVAVTDGVVDFVTWEDLYAQGQTDPVNRGGLSVAIVGDDGVRYYGSHLSEIAAGIEPGVRVGVGQLLGLTGRSGNADVTPPHLHFGISRPTTADDWEVRRGEYWPQPYLKAWRRGENVTPTL